MAKIAKKVINVEEGSVTWTFQDGEQITAFLKDNTPETNHQLALHGLSAKGGDSYAGAGDVEEEGGNPISWAKGVLRGVLSNLKAGLWSVRAEGGVRVTQLALAVAAVYGIAAEAAAEKLSEMEDEKKKALSANPKVASKLAQLKAEAAAKRAAAAQAQLDASDDELPRL